MLCANPSRRTRIYLWQMILWVILGIAWLGVLAAGIALCRLVAYCENKLRDMNGRLRNKQIATAVPESADEIFIPKRDAAA